MKRIVFLTLFCLLSVNSFAQSKFNYGITLGGNCFSLRGSDLISETKSKLGFSYGTSVAYRINSKFSLNSGFFVEQKNIGYNSVNGYRITDSSGDYVYETIYEYDVTASNSYKYFSVPLFLRYYIGRRNIFFTNLGFFSAHLQSYEKTIDRGNSRESQSYSIQNTPENFPLAEEFQGLDYGLSFGIGKVFVIDKSNTLSLEIRDNYGLANTVRRINKYGVSGSINTNNLNLFIEWSFNFNNKKG